MFFPPFKARPQFLIMSIFTLKPKIVRDLRVIRVIIYTLSFKQNQKEHTVMDYSIKEGFVIYNSLLY